MVTLRLGEDAGLRILLLDNDTLAVGRFKNKSPQNACTAARSHDSKAAQASIRSSPGLTGGLHGEWEAAHQIAQDDTSAEGAWVHAWLHRIEGDLDNARYWYRRAQREVAEGDLCEEGKTIAAFLLN